MDLLKVALVCYILAGLLFWGFVSLLAIAKKQTKVFEYGFLYLLVTVLLWPTYIIELFKN